MIRRPIGIINYRNSLFFIVECEKRNHDSFKHNMLIPKRESNIAYKKALQNRNKHSV